MDLSSQKLTSATSSRKDTQREIPGQSWFLASPVLPQIRFSLKAGSMRQIIGWLSLSPQLPPALGMSKCSSCQAGNLSLQINQNTVQTQAGKQAPEPDKLSSADPWAPNSTPPVPQERATLDALSAVPAVLSPLSAGSLSTLARTEPYLAGYWPRCTPPSPDAQKFSCPRVVSPKAKS